MIIVIIPGILYVCQHRFVQPKSLCIDLDIYFPLFITKNAEISACQEDQVAAIFDFVTVDLVVMLCVTESVSPESTS